MIKLYSIEIVYPATPETEAIAQRLVKELDSYRVPASVVKKTNKRSLADVTEPWLIVLCTPDTPSCKEVQERIAAFIADDLYHHILTLLVSGERSESFPPELLREERSDGTIITHSPLAGNIRARTMQQSLRLLSTEKIRLLAPFYGVSYDELWNRRRRARRRVALAVSAVVLTGASVFLAYALSRMRTISTQNQALQQQYEQAQEARDLAREERDAAREVYAGTTAIRAREILDKGDNELAMLLCLEFLPEAGQTTELTDILSEALHSMTREGYVPVTTVREYAKTRYMPDPVQKEPAETFPATITRPVPEEYDNGKETYDLSLEVESEEYGYAVYTGSFYISRTSASDVYRTRICFPDAPDRDYDLPFGEGAYGWLGADLILPDGSFIGREYRYPKYYSYRYDPFSGEFLPFYDEEEKAENGNAPDTGFLPGDPEALGPVGIHIGEAPGVLPDKDDLVCSIALDSGVQSYEEIEGLDGLVFGFTRGSYGFKPGDDAVKTYVYSKEPFRYLYTMEHVLKLYRFEESKYILGLTGSSVLVFSADPFRYLYTLEDEYTASIENFDYKTPYFPDGRNWLYTNPNNTKAVYDLETGKRLSVIADKDNGYDMEIAADGRILSTRNSHPVLWNPEDGSLIAEIPVTTGVSPDLFGDYDEAAGRRSAEALRVNAIVYVWNEEETQVPEDLKGQVGLARQLLQGRELTKMERKTYNLELPEEETE